MELIFIRHGETEFNKQHRAMGQRFDLELDEKGLSQAQEIIPKLPKELAAIYSSPLKRAAQTAQIIAKHFNKQVIYKDDLKERDFGSLSGKSWNQMEEETGEPITEKDNNLVYDYQPFGGESVEQVKARLNSFLKEMAAKHPNDCIIVVAHFGLISLMNSLHPHTEHHKLSNSSVHKFVIRQ